MKSKKSTAGERMIASAQQALAFAEGERNHGCVVHIPAEIDVKSIRQKFRMSQKQFSAFFGVSVRTLQEWEQGRALPQGAAKNFLMVLQREPEAVRRALTT